MFKYIAPNNEALIPMFLFMHTKKMSHLQKYKKYTLNSYGNQSYWKYIWFHIFK